MSKLPYLNIRFSQMKKQDRDALVRLLARIRDGKAKITGFTMETEKLAFIEYEGEEVK